MSSKIYRSYSYVIFGAEKVGKTNLITRFTKDQFTEAHTMTLEGQQTALLSRDGRIFEINIYDTAGQQNMISMKAVWRTNKNGFIFVYAINSKESFQVILKEIDEIKSQESLKDVAAILVGNKLDLDNQREVSYEQAHEIALKMGLNYFEVSAKTSFKEKIDKLIYQLIDTNEIDRFKESEKPQKTGTRSSIWHPCQSSSCQIM